jgi:hypothetical protein
MTDVTPKHWLLRIKDGKHFINSSRYSTWGINSTHPGFAKFLREVKEGDLLWFIKGGSKGQAIAVASYKESKERMLGPLISITMTNEELGWNEEPGVWDYEVHYTNLYNLTECNMLTEIGGQIEVRLYNEKCCVNLPHEYPYIVRYSKISTSM